MLAAYNPERPLSASRGVEVIDLFLRRRQRRKMLVWDGCTSRGIGRSLITAYFPAGELQFSIAFVVCVDFSVAFFLLCHNRRNGFLRKPGDSIVALFSGKPLVGYTFVPSLSGF